jgi:lipoate-protein ligase A
MNCQDIYNCLDFIRNCEEWKESLQELIYSDYTLDDISDFLTRKFLKSFISEYKFIVSFIEEDAVINIVSESIKECAVNIEESNHIVIKPFDINSILEQKINQVPILAVIDELKQKELETSHAADERRQKEWKAECDE